MSRQNVELIQITYRRVNEGGFSAIADVIHPDFEFDSPQGIEASQAHDKAGLREWFAKMDEIWEVLRFEPEEVVDIDATRVMAVVRTSGRARGSGIEIDQQLTHLWTILDGKATAIATFDTKQQALEAASSSSPTPAEKDR
jgi:ketosteroid isomerase-like protein